jgi:hypothetical protein
MLWLSLAGNAASDIITGATYGGVATTLVGKQLPDPSGSRWQYLFGLIAPATGANNVVISASGTCDFIIAVSADYSGVYQSLQPDASAVNQLAAGSTSLTSSVTTVADNDWVVLGHQGYFSNQAPSAGTGATRRIYDATFGAVAIFDSGGVVHPAGSYSMTTSYAGTASPFGHLLAAMKPDTYTPPGGFIPAWARNSNLPVIGTGTI